MSTKPEVRPGGLITVAFLKARFDEGYDHLSLFEPLVHDAIVGLGVDSFITVDVQAAIVDRHSVTMPQDILTTLLRRFCSRGLLHRENGRYFLRASAIESTLNNQKKSIEAGIRRLGERLVEHGLKRQLSFSSTDDAVDMLFRFIESEQVDVLLNCVGDDVKNSALDPRERLVTAEFIVDVVSKDEALSNVMRSILEGLVLYHAAFMPDISDTRRNFSGLTAAVDSGLIFQILGFEGDAIRTLMLETFSLLRDSGVRCVVFDKTVAEIRRVLSMFESKLASESGRLSLRPGTMSRHFLTTRVSPGDVRQMAATLELDIRRLGLDIIQTPDRLPEYTSDELRLVDRLGNRGETDEIEYRVAHDVDCVAAILTLRRGKRASRIEDAGYLFVSSSTLVIRNTRRWWQEDERRTGICPIVHVRALAGLAWLKKPGIARDFKMKELVALCAAALRPSHETWVRFIQHLAKLKASNAISSDEEAAIVVSSMSDTLLLESEEESRVDDDIDANTLDEIVDRVKASYREEAEALIKTKENEFSAIVKERNRVIEEQEKKLRDAVEELAATRVAAQERVRKKAVKYAKLISWCLFVIAAMITASGGISLLLLHEYKGGFLAVIAAVGVIVIVIMEVIGVLKHFATWRVRLHDCLFERFRKRFAEQ